VSSLLCVGSHDLNTLLQTINYSIILGDSRAALAAVAESKVRFQVVTLKKYVLSRHWTVDKQSCRCAVHVTAGYVSYQSNVTTQKEKP
jgi:hypothetical protein